MHIATHAHLQVFTQHIQTTLEHCSPPPPRGSRAGPASPTYLNGGEILVELGVERGELVDGAVEGAVVVAEHLTEEEGGEGHVHHDALVHGLAQHLAHKLEELQVVLVDVGRWRRVQALVPAGRLDGTGKGRGASQTRACINAHERVRTHTLKHEGA